MRSQHGFTLAEVMITLVIVGALMIGLGTLFISIQRVQAQASYIETANRAAQREIETLRNGTYNSLTPGQTIDFTAQLPSSLPSGATGTVTVSEPVAGLRRVDAMVTYRYGDISRDVTLSSLIGIIGVTQ